MQKILIGLFALFLLAVQIRPLIVYIHFKANQSYISQELCVNKERPKLNCEGKCFLMKKIEKLNQNREAQRPSSPVMPDVEKEKINLYSYEAAGNSFFLTGASLSNRNDGWFLLSIYLTPDTPPPDLS
ncbi:MAG: hypothetical protein AAGC85_00240 [Bacteroidota bacterium]